MSTAILNTTNLDFQSNNATIAKIVGSTDTISFVGSTTAGVTSDCDITGIADITTSADVDVGGILTVTGSTNMSAINTTGDAGIGGDATVGGTLDVTGDASFVNDAAVGGDATVTGTLGVTGDASFVNAAATGTLGVTGLASFVNTAATGNATVGGTLGVTGLASFVNAAATGTLGVTGLASFVNTAATGNATVGGTLGVTGLASFVNAAATGTLGVTGLASFVNTAATGNATVGGTLGVTGLASFVNAAATGTLGVTGLASFVNTAATGNATVGGTLGVTGDASFVNAAATGTLGVTGTSTLADVSMSGELNMNQQHIINVKEPLQSHHAATKEYVDAVSAGLHWQETCSVATTANISIATDLENTDSIDGVTLVTGMRVLVKDQTTASENGIYVVSASGTALRAAGFKPSDDVAGFAVFVEQGSSADQAYVVTNNTGSATPGTSALVFSQFTGTGQITAGDGLDKNGNTLSVNSSVIRDTGAQSMAGVLSITDATQSVSTATGALVISGGVGVAKDVFLGGALDIVGASTMSSASLSSTLSVAGDASITAATPSTSASSGALVVTGGVGIGEKLYVTGASTMSSASLSSTLSVAGVASITAATPSTSASSGALVVTGGAGIGEKLYVTDDITCAAEVNAVSFNATSDQNFKQDIEDINSSDLDRLLNVRAVSYRFKGVSDESKTRYGILAQDLEYNGLGHMVTTDKKGTKKVNYNDLVGLLIGEVKYLNKEVELLKNMA